jgi:DNA-binding response OmpR family regulator
VIATSTQIRTRLGWIEHRVLGLAAPLLEVLQQRGHRVDRASGCLLGLCMAAVGDFDTLMCDLDPLRLKGLGLCAPLRAWGHSLPARMPSAGDALDVCRAGCDRGAYDDMPKPFGLLVLEAVPHALRRRQRGCVPTTAVRGSPSRSRVRTCPASSPCTACCAQRGIDPSAVR